MNDQNPDVMVNEILSLADRVFRTLMPTIPDEILTLDITMPQMKILLMLYVHGPLRMSILANELRVTLPTATSLVDRLVDKNYVQREAQTDDRRVVLCRLAEGGQKAISGIWVSSRLRCQQILLSIEPGKLEMFKGAMEAMLQTANAQTAALANNTQYEESVKK